MAGGTDGSLGSAMHGSSHTLTVLLVFPLLGSILLPSASAVDCGNAMTLASMTPSAYTTDPTPLIEARFADEPEHCGLGCGFSMNVVGPSGWQWSQSYSIQQVGDEYVIGGIADPPLVPGKYDVEASLYECGTGASAHGEARWSFVYVPVSACEPGVVSTCVYDVGSPIKSLGLAPDAGPGHHIAGFVDRYAFALPDGAVAHVPCVALLADAADINPCVLAGGTFEERVLPLIERDANEPTTSDDVKICEAKLTATVLGFGLEGVSFVALC